MRRDAAIDDMFGHVPQKGELGLADDPVVARGPITHTPDTIRLLINETLALVRSATAMPWDARDLRFYTGLFPYWAEWLKNGEGDRLLAEFKVEMDRLGAPADQVAPNWRRIWGMAV